MQKAIFTVLVFSLFFSSTTVIINAQNEAGDPSHSSLQEVLSFLQARISGWLDRLSGFSKLSEVERKTEIRNLQVEVEEARELTNTAQSLVTPFISPPTLNRDLCIHSVGEDVRELQRFLNRSGFTVSQEGAGSIGKETTYYGNLTVSAVKKFQKSIGISPIGCVGSKTREFFETSEANASHLIPNCAWCGGIRWGDIIIWEQACRDNNGTPVRENFNFCVSIPSSGGDDPGPVACGGHCGVTLTCLPGPNGYPPETQITFWGHCGSYQTPILEPTSIHPIPIHPVGPGS